MGTDAQIACTQFSASGRVYRDVFELLHGAAPPNQCLGRASGLIAAIARGGLLHWSSGTGTADPMFQFGGTTVQADPPDSATCEAIFSDWLRYGNDAGTRYSDASVLCVAWADRLTGNDQGSCIFDACGIHIQLYNIRSRMLAMSCSLTDSARCR